MKHLPLSPFTGQLYQVTTFGIAFYQSNLSTGRIEGTEKETEEREAELQLKNTKEQENKIDNKIFLNQTVKIYSKSKQFSSNSRESQTLKHTKCVPIDFIIV